MAEYVAFDPANESDRSGIIAVIESLGHEEIDHLITKYDIGDKQWFSQQIELDILKALSENNSFLDMVSIGMKIPDVADFPPASAEVSVHEVLEGVRDAYESAVRGPNTGSYEYTKLGDRKGRMVCNNPYPSDFDYGLIYRIVQKYRPDDSEHVLVVRDESVQNRRTGGDTCIYDISW